eukprot:gene10917-12697_t
MPGQALLSRLPLRVQQRASPEWHCVFLALSTSGALVWEPEALLRTVEGYPAMEAGMALKLAKGLTELRRARHGGEYEQCDCVALARAHLAGGIGMQGVHERQRQRAKDYGAWWSYCHRQCIEPQSYKKKRMAAQRRDAGGGDEPL